MSQLSVESMKTLSDALIDEIGRSLHPGDPQTDLFAEQMAALNEITATPSTYFVARSSDSITGYGRARQRTPGGNTWLFDVILLSGPEDEIARTIYGCAQNEVNMRTVEWWTRGPVVDVVARISSQVGLHRDRTINRMEIEMANAPEAHPVPTRAFALDDVAEIVRVNNEAFAEHPDRAQIDQARLMNDFESMGSRYEDLRVLEDAKAIGGFVWVEEKLSRYGEIYVLALDKSHQGKGFGHHLLDAGMVRLRETYGSRRALLYVESTNEHAIGLYKNYGFEDVGLPLVSFTNGQL